jgi:F-type H+-transporting ATPase subunit b
MGDVNLSILAAEEGGQSNFLIPNGTFFFVLLIFLIVLGVIAKWVVPPISKVLREREEMVHKTTEDNRRAAQLRAAADADYLKVMATARREATNVREEARAEGRKIVDEARADANTEVSSVLQRASEELTEQSRAVTAELQTAVGSLSAQLASRVLGVEVTTRTVPATTGQGR